MIQKLRIQECNNFPHTEADVILNIKAHLLRIVQREYRFCAKH